jgi:hypothetical protein
MVVLYRISIILLGLLGTLTVFIYIYDGYRQNNIKKGVYYVLGFFVFITLSIVLINTFRLWFAFVIPMLFLIFIVVKWLNGKSN